MSQRQASWWGCFIGFAILFPLVAEGIVSEDARGRGSAANRTAKSPLMRRDVIRGNAEPMLRAQSQGTLETLPRMRWWYNRHTALPRPDKYLFFTFDDGGLNNIRIGWEMTGIVARRTKRTLVLPPPAPMYLLDFGPGMNRQPERYNKTTGMEDLINLEQLRAFLPVMTHEEFERTTNFKWKEAVRQAEQLDLKAVKAGCHIGNYEAVKGKFLFMDGKSPRREGFFCGQWIKLGGPEPGLQATNADWALLTHGFVWHEDVFRIAAQVVKYLGTFKYAALHARYNDFQYHDVQQPPQTILNKWGQVLNFGSILYVASDEPKKFRNLQLPAGMKLLTWDNLFESTADQVLVDVKAQFTPERWFKLTGPVEELICTYARIFIGSAHSTFSGHVTRMRKHADAPVDSRLLHTDTPNAKQIQDALNKWERRTSLNAFRTMPENAGNVFLQVSE